MTPEQKKSLEDAKRIAGELEESIKLMEAGVFSIRDSRHPEDATAEWIARQKKVLANLRNFIASVEG